VLGCLGVEFVGRQLVGTGQQPEAVLGDHIVHVTGLAAHRAIAVDGFHVVRHQYLEGNGAAMTAALMPSHIGSRAHNQAR